MKNKVLNLKGVLLLSLCLVLLSLFAGCLNNEVETDLKSSSLRGRVIDNKTGEPLQNSIVSLGEEIISTDENGFFLIEDLKTGKYELGVAKLDEDVSYKEYTRVINVDKDIKLEVELQQGDRELETEFFTTGDYSIRYVSRTGPNNAFTLFYPRDLSRESFPVITWGNGTGAIPEIYYGLLSNLASHGFIVIAPRSSNTGNGEEMLQGVEWLIEENDNPNSNFHTKVDIDNIGATGHSQGGGGALNVGSDSRIETTVLIQPALFGGNVRNLTGPTFIISGGRDFIVPARYIERAFYRPAEVPLVYGNLNRGSHLTPIGSASGMAEYIISWFKANLKDDLQAQKEFAEGNGIFTDRSWEVKAKENKQLF